MSSSTTAIRDGKLSLQQIQSMSTDDALATIDPIYFNPPTTTSRDDEGDEFDAIQFFLEQDPELDLTTEYLNLELLRHDKALKSVNNQLAKTVMENYTSFVQGMTKVQEVGMDLTKTSILCKNGRKRLQHAQEDVVKGGLSVLAKYRQRKSFMNLVHYLTKIKDILEKEKELYQLVEEGDFPAAIQLMIRHRAAIASCRQFHAIRQLDSNIQKGYQMLAKKVEDALIAVLGSFDALDYERVLIAHKCQIPPTELTEKIRKYYVAAVEGLLHEVALSFALRNQKMRAKTEEVVKMKFGELCRNVSSDDLLPCLLQALSVLSDLMLNYYAIYDWHMNKDSRSDETLSQYDFSAERKFVDSFRADLWETIQRKFSIFLGSANFALFKIDRFLQVFHALNMLCELGEEFSDTNSHQLRGALKAKSQAYFANYHRENLEHIKLMMESETWQRLDPSCFSLRNVPQFDQSYSHRRSMSNDRVEQYIKQVRMFLHSDDPDQNPFKVAAEKGMFFLEDPEVDDEQQNNNRYQSDSDDDEMGDDESDEEVEQNQTKSQELSKRKQIEKKKQGPVFTIISMNILKQMGVYVHSMEVLQLISIEIFYAFASLYKFYLYTVHSMFSEVPDPTLSMNQQQVDVNALLPENDMNIPDSLKEIFRDIRQSLNTYNNEKFFTIARPAQQLQVQLRSQKTQYGFYERSVAAESLAHMQSAIAIVSQERLVQLLPKVKVPLVEQFVQQMQTASNNVRNIIYERERKALFGKKYEDRIDKKWTPTQLNRESAYVSAISTDLTEFKKIMDILETNENIPAESTNILWTNVLKSVMESIVEGYSRIKSLNHQGIAQMQMDIKALGSSLERIVPQSLRIAPPGTQRKEVPYLYLVRSYIEGFYNSADYMIQWVQDNKDNFTLSQTLNMVQIAPEMQNLKRKERNDLIAKIEEMYKGSSGYGVSGAVSSLASAIQNSLSDVPSPVKPPSFTAFGSNNSSDSQQRESTNGTLPPVPNIATTASKKPVGNSMWNKGIGLLKRDNQDSSRTSIDQPRESTTTDNASRVSIDGGSSGEHGESGGGMKKSNSMWNNLNIGGVDLGASKFKQGMSNLGHGLTDMGKLNVFKRRGDDANKS